METHVWLFFYQLIGREFLLQNLITSKTNVLYTYNILVNHRLYAILESDTRKGLEDLYASKALYM